MPRQRLRSIPTIQLIREPQIQQVGRGVRPAPGKTECVILDFSGITLRHGPIDAPILADLPWWFEPCNREFNTSTHRKT